MLLCGCGRLASFSARTVPSTWTHSRHVRIPTIRVISRHLYRGKGVVASQSIADSFVGSLSPRERGYLQEALRIHQEQERDKDTDDVRPPTVQQLRLVAFHSAIPFIGFGFLDNAIMIIAGEYIDQTLGIAFGISTMAAAALGNLISDVSGMSLAHYVELAADKLGFQGPGLSSRQMEMPRARFSANLGRAIGISIGCILGMFPLLFYSKKDDEENNKSSS